VLSGSLSVLCVHCRAPAVQGRAAVRQHCSLRQPAGGDAAGGGACGPRPALPAVASQHAAHLHTLPATVTHPAAVDTHPTRYPLHPPTMTTPGALSTQAAAAKAVDSQAATTKKPSRYAQPFKTQLVECTRKLSSAYWRMPQYNFTRLCLSVSCGLIYGLMYLGVSHRGHRGACACMQGACASSGEAVHACV